ncbi:MAG: hypothetical protein Kow0031_02380 [Anaerolineae bacterium]
MTTRLKIDLTHGVLEVEGSEAFVRAIYSDFKAQFIGEEAGESLGTTRQRRRRRRNTAPQAAPAEPPEPAAATGIAPAESAPGPPAPAPEPEPAPAAPPKPPHNFLENLDLSAGDGRASLVEFMDAKFPITNEERNLVFLYYLQHILKTRAITADHIYTCYKAAKIRVPLNLESSLKATAAQRRWIKMTKTGRLSTTPSGKLYVEKQLPKKLKN